MPKRKSDKAPEVSISFAGFLKVRCLLFAPQFFLDISGDELKIYLYLLFLSERYPEEGQKAHKRAAVPYISRGTGVPLRTVERCLPHLRNRGLLKIAKRDSYNGNIFWINPRFLEPDQYRQTGGTIKEWYRQIGGTCGASPGTGYRQFGGQQPDTRSISTSLINTTQSDAPHQTPLAELSAAQVYAFDGVKDLGKGDPSGSISGKTEKKGGPAAADREKGWALTLLEAERAKLREAAEFGNR